MIPRAQIEAEHAAILLMGVCGAGKTTIGRQLAERIGGTFLDADDLHTDDNVKAMRTGRPLTDAMRAPWLARVGLVAEEARRNAPVVLACSALKRAYRDALRSRIRHLRLVHLHGAPEVIAARLRARTGHFMPPGLLESQLADLETPDPSEAAMTLDIAAPPHDLIATALAALPAVTPDHSSQPREDHR